MQVPTQVSNAQAIVLCGGMGARMGALTQDIPKPLIRIHGTSCGRSAETGFGGSSFPSATRGS